MCLIHVKWLKLSGPSYASIVFISDLSFRHSHCVLPYLLHPAYVLLLSTILKVNSEKFILDSVEWNRLDPFNHEFGRKWLICFI